MTSFPKSHPIVDRKALAECRKRPCDRCENPKVEPPHHFVRTSFLRLDLPENLISFCWDCHRRVHDGERDLEYAIMAQRNTLHLEALAPTWGGWVGLEDYRDQLLVSLQPFDEIEMQVSSSSSSLRARP